MSSSWLTVFLNFAFLTKGQTDKLNVSVFKKTVFLFTYKKTYELKILKSIGQELGKYSSWEMLSLKKREIGLSVAEIFWILT